MKYLALSLSLAAFVGVAQGINCWVCEDAEGNRAPCDGTNEQDKACGAYTIGKLQMNLAGLACMTFYLRGQWPPIMGFRQNFAVFNPLIHIWPHYLGLFVTIEYTQLSFLRLLLG